jgi:hypothetical protein
MGLQKGIERKPGHRVPDRKDIYDILIRFRCRRYRETEMATYQILYWQEIPSQVDAREAGKSHKEMLSQRFQELIDIVATKRNLTESDDYIAGWSKGEKSSAPVQRSTWRKQSPPSWRRSSIRSGLLPWRAAVRPARLDLYIDNIL